MLLAIAFLTVIGRIMPIRTRLALYSAVYRNQPRSRPCTSPRLSETASLLGFRVSPTERRILVPSCGEAVSCKPILENRLTEFEYILRISAYCDRRSIRVPARSD